MSSMAFFSKSAASTADDDIDSNDAVQFWQREVYYYEGRAGEQGATANRLLTVAVGATAVIPVVANLLNDPLSSRGLDVRPMLFFVPVLVLLLSTSALRLLHEMHLLRVYVQRAEQELQSLTAKQPLLDKYTRWADHGGKHDFSYYVMLVWFLTAISLGIGGTFGITAFVAANLDADRVLIALAPLCVAVAILVFSGFDTTSDVIRLKRSLGLEPTPQGPPAVNAFVVVAGFVASLTLVVAAPVAVVALVGSAAPVASVSCAVLVFSLAVTAVGIVAGGLSWQVPDSLGRKASRVLVAIAQVGSLVPVFMWIAGYPLGG